jgi:hypothetical protein
MLESGFRIAAKFRKWLLLAAAALGGVFAIGALARLVEGEPVGAANLVINAGVAVGTLYAAVWALLFVAGVGVWIISWRPAS